MEYYCRRLNDGRPVAVFRYDPVTRRAEVYNHKQRYWRRDWFLLAQFMIGDMGRGDMISEEEAMEIIEGFG